MRTSQKVLS